MTAELPGDSHKDLAQAVLDHMRVPLPYKRVYYLGSHASRLTFLSQQHRAFNLVWALQAKGLLGTRVAVVGAGLSGVTAGLAARQAGAAVTLLERKPEVLHLQRGSQLRYIHPNIYDWPDPKALEPMTDLPCLNWGAAMAASVIETILRRWESLRGDIALITGINVTGIESVGDGDPIVNGEGPITHRQSYNTVIVAAGFGLESALAGVPFLSYWENDNLSRPVLAEPIPRRYLVTGCGDGGLIDAARLCIKDFDHARFVNQFLEDPSLDSIRERLPMIDQEAAALLSRADISSQADTAVARLHQFAGEGGLPFDESSTREAVSIDIQARYLHQEYDRLAIPKHLSSSFSISQPKRPAASAPQNAALREDTVVYLNGPYSTPFSLGASILSRFIVFLLRKYGRLEYYVGRVQVDSTEPRRRYHIRLQRPFFPDRRFEVDEIVVRHGPKPIIEELFGKSVADKLRRPYVDIDDPTRHKCYPSGFLANPVWDNFNRQDRLGYAVANMNRAGELYLQAGRARRVCIEVHGGRPRYRVALNEREDLLAGQTLASFPVHFDWPSKAVKKGKMSTPSSSDSKPRRSIYVGSGVGDEPGVSRTTLGCFVLTSDGRPALFTSSFAFPSPSLGHSVYAGRLPVATLEFWQRPSASALGATLAADTVVMNETEGAIAVLQHGAKWDSGYGRITAKLPPIRGVGDAKFGQSVFKIGWGSGLTYGAVRVLHMITQISTSDGTVWFKRFIGIIGNGRVPFSKSGDSGAMVITMDGDVLGHIVAGSESMTMVCPARVTLAAFGCTLLAGSSPAPT